MKIAFILIITITKRNTNSNIINFNNNNHIDHNMINVVIIKKLNFWICFTSDLLMLNIIRDAEIELLIYNVLLLLLFTY